MTKKKQLIHPLKKVREVISKEFDLTQNDLALGTKYSKAMIWKVESGKEPMSPKLANAIDSFLGTNFREWVFNGSIYDAYEIDEIFIISSFKEAYLRTLQKTKYRYLDDDKKKLAPFPKYFIEKFKPHLKNKKEEDIKKIQLCVQKIDMIGQKLFTETLTEIGIDQNTVESLKHSFRDCLRSNDVFYFKQDIIKELEENSYFSTKLLHFEWSFDKWISTIGKELKLKSATQRELQDTFDLVQESEKIRTSLSDKALEEIVYLNMLTGEVVDKPNEENSKHIIGVVLDKDSSNKPKK